MSASNAAVIPCGWPAPARVHAVTTTRELRGDSLPPYEWFNLGRRSGEAAEIVAANRSRLEQALALPSPPRWLHQVHGRDVVEFDEASLGTSVDEPRADAAITRDSGVVLAILSADCLPILLCADDGSEIAAAHAGWRGLSAGIIESCVGRMRTPAGRLMAWLGAAIGPQSYEVGTDVRNAFVASDAAADGAFRATRAGHWLCDLYSLARRRLASLGVLRVHGGGLDTFADSRFYSYRRDGARSGRFATLIHIEPDA